MKRSDQQPPLPFEPAPSVNSPEAGQHAAASPALIDTSAFNHIQQGNFKPPRLLVQWQPFWPVFLENLADELLRREPPPLKLLSPLAPFWPDVFVHRPVAWNKIGQSVFLHVAAFMFIFSTNPFWWETERAKVLNPYDHTSITFYPLSDYLPPVKSAAPKVKNKVASKGDPEFARQEITSFPRNPDNSTQTIVNPPHPDIMVSVRDVPLPNLVVDTPIPGPPTSALTHAKLIFPEYKLNPLPPPPDTQRKRASVPDVPLPDIIKPAPEPKRSLLTEIDVQMAVATEVEKPKLPLNVERKTLSKVDVGNVEPIPPTPDTQGAPASKQAMGRLMALSLRPTAPQGEIKVPDGSRSGVFSATPAGRAGAAGTPEVIAATTNNGPPGTVGNGSANSPVNGNARDNAGAGTGNTPGSPAGITITGGPLKPGTSAVVGNPQNAASGRNPNQDHKVIASAKPPTRHRSKTANEYYASWSKTSSSDPNASSSATQSPSTAPFATAVTYCV